MESQTKTSILRISSLSVGCLACGISFVLNAFNVFALALKVKFNLSQAQLEGLLSVLFLGLIASLPGGLMLGKFGARPTALLALAISAFGYMLIWGATLATDYYQCHFLLLALFFLVAGIGGGLTYMAGTASNVPNFGAERRGTVVGILHAFLSLGPAIIMVVYNEMFVKGHYSDEENQDLSGFFLFCAVTFATINGLGIIFYDNYPPDVKIPKSLHYQKPSTTSTFNSQNNSVEYSLELSTSTPKEETPRPDVRRTHSVTFKNWIKSSFKLDSSHESNSLLSGATKDDVFEDAPSTSLLVKAFRVFPKLSGRAASASAPDTSCLENSHSELMRSTTEVLANTLSFKQEDSWKSSLKDILSLDFQLLFWPFIILTAQQMMFVQNLTTILKSIGHEELNSYFPYISPILGTLAKPALGFASDIFIVKIPRAWFITIGCVINVAVWCLSMFFIDTVAMVLIATTLCDVSAYTVYAVGPAMMIERFGMNNFSRNWGLFMGGFAILTALLVTIFGLLYDMEIKDSTASECYGKECFMTNFMVSEAMSVVSFLCMIVYIYLEKRRNDLYTLL